LRYATAEDLADDLRAWADGAPVSARAPRWHERLLRWVRRHPAASVIIVSVGCATVELAAHHVRLKREIDRANSETARANLQRQYAVDLYVEGRAALNRLKWRILELSDRADASDEELIDRHLQDAIDYSQGIVDAAPGEDSYANLSHVYRIAAVIELRRRNGEASLKHLQAAEEAIKKVIEFCPDDDQWVAEAARIDVGKCIALLEESDADLNEASRLICGALAEFHRISAEFPEDRLYQLDLAWAAQTQKRIPRRD